jgi:hypothetical protein
VDNPARVFADQVRRDLLDRRGDRSGTPFDDRLAEADDSRVSMNLQEEPSRLDEQGLQLGDPDPISLRDLSSGSASLLGFRLGLIGWGRAQRRKGSRKNRAAADNASIFRVWMHHRPRVVSDRKVRHFQSTVW